MNIQDRPRRSASEWSALIEQQIASGQSQREFCEEQGLAVSTFTYWKRKLGSGVAAKRPSEADAPLFTPINVLPDSAAAAAEVESAHSGWSIDLDLGDGLRLSIRKVA